MKKMAKSFLNGYYKFLRTLRLSLNPWVVLSTIFVTVISVPLFEILTRVFQPTGKIWTHISRYLLADYLTNSALLLLGVGIITFIIGFGLAWLITIYDFPFRKHFEWMLILPLAVPPYIAAYTYSGLLSYTGPLQSFLRNVFGFQGSTMLIDIMSLPGAVFIFSFFLFPYVYIISKAFLTKQSSSMIEASRSLGKNTTQSFFKVIIPLSKTAIIAGISIVLLEVLNDYGVVKFFGIPTFSTAIFRTWLSMGETNAAIKLAAVLMIFAFGILLVERLIRRRQKFSISSRRNSPISRKKLKGPQAKLMFLLFFLPLLFGYIAPVLQLGQWTLLTYSKILNLEFFELVLHSFGLAFFSALIIIVIAVVIANTVRLHDSKFSKIVSRLANMGYSIPAAVIAIGVMLFFTWIDNTLTSAINLFSRVSVSLVLSGTLLLLTFAYIVRFLTVAYGAVETGFDKIGKSFYEASRSLGKNTTETFFKVEYKLLKPALFSGFILVFVDILKELPLTLILRPFNFSTLATKAFEYADDEMIHEAAIASLIIIIISTVSVFFFHKLRKREE